MFFAVYVLHYATILAGTRTGLPHKLIKWKRSEQTLHPRQAHHHVFTVREMGENHAAPVRMCDRHVHLFARYLICRAVYVVYHATHACFHVINHDTLVDVEAFPRVCRAVAESEVGEELIRVASAKLVYAVYGKPAHNRFLVLQPQVFPNHHCLLGADLPCTGAQKNILVSVHHEAVVYEILEHLEEEHAHNDYCVCKFVGLKSEGSCKI